jgi:hypothetical protein
MEKTSAPMGNRHCARSPLPDVQADKRGRTARKYTITSASRQGETEFVREMTGMPNSGF